MREAAPPVIAAPIPSSPPLTPTTPRRLGPRPFHLPTPLILPDEPRWPDGHVGPPKRGFDESSIINWLQQRES